MKRDKFPRINGDVPDSRYCSALFSSKTPLRSGTRVLILLFCFAVAEAFIKFARHVARIANPFSLIYVLYHSSSIS